VDGIDIGEREVLFNWWLVGLFYLMALCCIAFVSGFYQLVNRPRFRNDQGDVSTEVGYEEDSVGHPFGYANDDFDRSHVSPHVNAPGNSSSGPM
jgi:hypothetical protein